MSLYTTGTTYSGGAQAGNPSGGQGAGFLKAQNPQQWQAHQDSLREYQEGGAKGIFVDELSAYIKEAQQVVVRARQTAGIDGRLISNLKQYKGEYTNAKLAEIRKFGGSEVYMKDTGVKCRAITTILSEIFNPFDSKVWELEPTPQPELLPEEVSYVSNKITLEIFTEELQRQGMDPSQITPEQLASMMNQLGQQFFFEKGQEIRSRIEEEIQERAQDAADGMSQLIYDQMVEGGWDSAIYEFLHNLPIFPAAFLKVELVRKKGLQRVLTPNGWKMKVSERVVNQIRAPSPFDIYPSPDSANIDDGYLFERHKFTRSYLNSIKTVFGVNGNAVDLILDRYQRLGRHVYLNTDQERAEAEGRANEYSYRNEHIDGWEFHGSVSGLLLAQWGYPFSPPENGENPLTKDYEINAILVDEVVVKAAINENPLGNRPYTKASYVNVPGSFWGLGCPDLMHDTAAIGNAFGRAIVNNASFSSGPITGIDVTRIAQGEDPEDIHPFKVFQLQNPTGSASPPIMFFQPRNMIRELLEGLQAMRKLSDDQTGIPGYIYGDKGGLGGAGRTASGLSMMLNNARLLITQSVGNIDRGILKKLVEFFFNYNMLYHPDEGIKGDMKMRSKGLLGQVIKESQLLQLRTFRESTTNDYDMQIIGVDGRAKILREEQQLLGIPDVIPDDDVIGRNIAMDNQEQQAMLEKEEQRFSQEQQYDMEKQNADQEFELLKQGRQQGHETNLEKMRLRRLRDKNQSSKNAVV